MRTSAWLTCISTSIKLGRPNHGRSRTGTIAALVGLGFALSACSANVDYSPPPYSFSGPTPGSSISDFLYGDGWRGQTFSEPDDGQFGGHVPPPF